MYHRGQQATARDLFDLSVVIERDADALRAAAPFRHSRVIVLEETMAYRSLPQWLEKSGAAGQIKAQK
jgi:hypothetical protein